MPMSLTAGITICAGNNVFRQRACHLQTEKDIPITFAMYLGHLNSLLCTLFKVINAEISFAEFMYS